MVNSDSIDAILEIAERRYNMSSIRDMLRISRLKLGSAMEQLETVARRTEIADEVRAHAETVAFEIDALLETIHKSRPNTFHDDDRHDRH